ncbi:Six-hairpin glycosidase [Violaceomyces palustris]|uniref:Six-hairpin glycosidase n=1 Tax=Violaceomyces palustris TaxID=1673888 RepID=A0ACD0NYM4_9BASI|nr:Six-hairpin glycosidase [Violaceomyces palustris]
MEAKYVRWRQNYLRSSDQGLYCFYNGKGDNGDAITCSEAHGYAMLIAVLHRNQQDFDGLLRFFLNFRNKNGLMKWQIRMKNGQTYVEEDGESSATDGDIDIATSLFQASKLFPQGGPPAYPPGTYFHEASRLCKSILDHTIHPTLHVPLLGDWCNQESNEARRLYDSTRSSDFILSSFLLFHRMHPDPNVRSRWQEVLESTLQLVLSQPNPSGLIADFYEFDRSSSTWRPARGKLLESENDGQMSWNACRTPWRLAHYYAVTGDRRILPLLERMKSTLQDPRRTDFPKVRAGIRVEDGAAMVDYSDRSFIAPVGYLCHSLGDSQGHRSCVDALNQEEESYFGDSIDLVIAEQAMAAPYWL